jgi:hypothetical protein
MVLSKARTFWAWHSSGHATLRCSKSAERRLQEMEREETDILGGCVDAVDALNAEEQYQIQALDAFANDLERRCGSHASK